MGTPCGDPGSVGQCDGSGKCVECFTDLDCTNPDQCANGVFSPAVCTGGMCELGQSMDCTLAKLVCTPDGCATPICTSNVDCGPVQVGGCMQPTCVGGACQMGPAPQGTPCTDAQGATCDADGLCILAKYVFVTSGTFTSNLGGTTGADGICQGIAGGIPLGGTWISWTSDDPSGVLTRLTPLTQLPYLLLDGTMVLSSGASLASTSVPFLIGIDVDETLGLQTDQIVWTGTTPGGINSGASCGNWLGSPNVTAGTVGHAGATDLTWTDLQPEPCNTTTGAHLYCFLK
jgi:hypothetical protein